MSDEQFGEFLKGKLVKIEEYDKDSGKLIKEFQGVIQQILSPMDEEKEKNDYCQLVLINNIDKGHLCWFDFPATEEDNFYYILYVQEKNNNKTIGRDELIDLEEK